MSHSNCDDSKFPESKGKEVLVKSNFYVKTFVERSNHHSEKPIFSFLINQRRLNTRSNRPKELQRRRLRTEEGVKNPENEVDLDCSPSALPLLLPFHRWSCASIVSIFNITNIWLLFIINIATFIYVIFLSFKKNSSGSAQRSVWDVILGVSRWL